MQADSLIRQTGELTSLKPLWHGAAMNDELLQEQDRMFQEVERIRLQIERTTNKFQKLQQQLHDLRTQIKELHQILHHNNDQ